MNSLLVLYDAHHKDVYGWQNKQDRDRVGFMNAVDKYNYFTPVLILQNNNGTWQEDSLHAA
jgi:hypothetical protein